MRDATQILERHPDNPLINADDLPGYMSIFNPSPALYDGKTVLLLSMIPFRHSHGGETHVALSDDGLHFTIAEEPFFSPGKLPHPCDMMNRHLIDNRVTQIDDTYYILTPALSGSGFMGPCTFLGRTRDFKRYGPMGIIDCPVVRGTSLFPAKIGGKYYKLVRPGAGTESRGEIWISSSPDLLHWGDCRPLLKPGYAFWNGLKIGPTPPIETDAGWLTIIHGVSHPCDGSHYYMGAVLLDREQPWKIIGRTYSYILAPEAKYETTGHVSNVVFPCGALADREKDELRVYYGAADTCVCLAEGKLSELVQACLDEI